MLKSKLFNFSDNELVEIRKLDMKIRFFETIELFEKLENEAIRRKRSLNFIVNEKLERFFAPAYNLGALACFEDFGYHGNIYIQKRVEEMIAKMNDDNKRRYRNRRTKVNFNKRLLLEFLKI